jgi:hypothetical protein
MNFEDSTKKQSKNMVDEDPAVLGYQERKGRPINKPSVSITINIKFFSFES